MVKLILPLVTFFVILPMQNAYAYLDPGTIGMVMQAVVAGFVGGLFFLKRNWETIKSKLKKTEPKLENQTKQDKED